MKFGVIFSPQIIKMMVKGKLLMHLDSRYFQETYYIYILNIITDSCFIGVSCIQWFGITPAGLFTVTYEVLNYVYITFNVDNCLLFTLSNQFAQCLQQANF